MSTPDTDSGYSPPRPRLSVEELLAAKTADPPSE